MAYKYKKKTAARRNYGGKRALQKIKWIVWHYTANDGDTDEDNGKYFANNIIKASAHAFADDDSITQSVPDDHVAYSVGGSKYSDCKKTGGGKYYGTVTNTNSLSIELCDDVKNGKIYPSEGTIENAIAWTKHWMKKYGIPASRVIRHFDVNGKRCPAYWCGSESKDKLWTEIKKRLGDAGTATPTVSVTVRTEDDDKLETDGLWGKDTTRGTQKVMGTYKDGIVSDQLNSCKKYLPNCLTSSWDFGKTGDGSPMVKAIQELVGAKQDGFCGEKTVTAIQKFLNKKGFKCGKTDGYMGKKTVTAWQMYINTKL